MKRLGLLGTAIRGPLVQSSALTGLGVGGLTFGAMCVAGAIVRGVAVPPPKGTSSRPRSSTAPSVSSS